MTDLERILRNQFAARREYILSKIKAEGAATPPALLTEYTVLDELQATISSAAKKARLRDPFDDRA